MLNVCAQSRLGAGKREASSPHTVAQRNTSLRQKSLLESCLRALDYTAKRPGGSDGEGWRWVGKRLQRLGEGRQMTLCLRSSAGLRFATFAPT
jgi:hypothetical protein